MMLLHRKPLSRLLTRKFLTSAPCGVCFYSIWLISRSCANDCPSFLGTTRALLQNHITGVSEGHICVLSLVGVGYRATIEDSATTVSATYPGQKFVSLKVGFSHPIELPIPKGVTASTPQPTRILLESVDKREVTHFAAEIREWRRPEPYKGKGIFVNGETIKLKAKKIK